MEPKVKNNKYKKSPVNKVFSFYCGVSVMDWFRRNLSPWRNKKNHPKTKKYANNSTGAISETTHSRLDDFINITEDSEDCANDNKIGNEKEKDLMLKNDEYSAEENINTNTNINVSAGVIVDNAVFEPVDETEILMKNVADDSTPLTDYEQELNSVYVSSSNNIAPETEIDTDNSVDHDTDTVTNDTLGTTTNSNSSSNSSPSPSPSSTSPKHQKYPHHPQSKKFLNLHQQREHFRNIVIQQPR